MVYAAYSDLKTMEIPDKCFILIMLLAEKPCITWSLILLGVYLLIALLFHLAGSSVPMGFGDMKILFSLCFSLGPIFAFRCFAAASLLSGAYGIYILAKNRFSNDSLKTAIPFMPFLALGFIAASILSFL